MQLGKVTLILVGLMLALVSSQAANAGPYVDDLSKCLVASTTSDDRSALVRWLFFSASSHPALASTASVSKEQLDVATKKTADLFVRLLTRSCAAEARKALRYEGQVAMQLGFQVLGQVAGQELFSSPEVSANVAGLGKYIDTEKLKSKLSAN